MHWAKLNDAMTRTDGPLVSPPGDTLLDVLQGFVHELRAAGLPVSMTEKASTSCARFRSSFSAFQPPPYNPGPNPDRPQDRQP